MAKQAVKNSIDSVDTPVQLPIRTIWNPPGDPGLDCSDSPSLTKQSDKDSCDINQILKRFEETGQLPEMIKNNPQYGDFSDPLDYQAALNVVNIANEQFMAMPAAVRTRFGHSPEAFLAFCNDPKNGDELVRMGLATKKPEPPVKGAEAAGSNLPKDSVPPTSP
jgi:phage internal scaffolding protein